MRTLYKTDISAFALVALLLGFSKGLLRLEWMTFWGEMVFLAIVILLLLIPIVGSLKAALGKPPEGLEPVEKEAFISSARYQMAFHIAAVIVMLVAFGPEIMGWAHMFSA